MAAVNLPHGAGITKFVVYYYDNSTSDIYGLFQSYDVDKDHTDTLFAITSTGEIIIGYEAYYHQLRFNAALKVTKNELTFGILTKRSTRLMMRLKMLTPTNGGSLSCVAQAEAV